VNDESSHLDISEYIMLSVLESDEVKTLSVHAARVLIVEDQVLVRRSIASVVQTLGAEALEASSLVEARDQLTQGNFDLMLLDLTLPDGDGLELLAEIQRLKEPPEVIILTGTGDADGAETALKSGAWDYLMKPVTDREISQALRRVLDYRRQKMKKSDIPTVARAGIIGSGPEMARCLALVGRVATSDSSVLITGET